jgi:gamma-polyglutamate synthase
MTFLYILLTLSLAALVAAGVAERRRHERRLEAIPVRILVNGSRGKSSVTRLCAGALRGGGRRVVAKTTGTAPRMIWPDAHETPIERRYGIANITEQIGVIRDAAVREPDAVVVECMAVDPALQEITQSTLVRSTIGVITNVRQDHLSEMGPRLRDVARALSSTMPRNGVCVTAATAATGILEAEARRRNCRLVYADPDSVADIDMEPFGPFAFKENVAVAIAVAAELGISRHLALRGMWSSPPDPGVLSAEEYHLGGKVVRFANILAANDPASTVANFERLYDWGLIRPPVFTVINCRPDRLDRNRQMGVLVPQLMTDRLFLVGHPTRSARAAVPPKWHGEVVDLGGPRRDPADILDAILARVTDEASVVAIGNIHGQGELLLDQLVRSGRRPEVIAP